MVVQTRKSGLDLLIVKLILSRFYGPQFTERRTAIKNLIIIAGGIPILPSCSPGKEKASIQLNKLGVSADQEALLAEIAEAILPKTKTPGAKELGLHLFVLKMVDDCHDSEEQQKFITGLNEIEALSEKKSGTRFLKSS